jgi:hypothetical protein
MDISIFEYFAAHAPSEIPSWFKPDMLSERPKPRIRTYAKFNTNDDHIKWLKLRDEDGAWHEDDDVPIEFKNEVIAWEEGRNEEVASGYEWDRQYERQRYFQWRHYYAGMLTAELKKLIPGSVAEHSMEKP